MIKLISHIVWSAILLGVIFSGNANATTYSSPTRPIVTKNTNENHVIYRHQRTNRHY